MESRAQRDLAEALGVQEARVSATGTPAAPGSLPSERARQQAAVAKFKRRCGLLILDRRRNLRSISGSGRPGRARKSRRSRNSVSRSHFAIGNGIMAQMARLGLADAQARAGQYDRAINTFQELAQHKDGPLPVDGILMQLGRTRRDAGKRADAQQTFRTDWCRSTPDSPFTSEAKRNWMR